VHAVFRKGAEVAQPAGAATAPQQDRE
jgi:hypothetical protein